MRPTSEILADALASFEDGARWIQRRWWSGEQLETAEKFCSLGAIHYSMARHGEVDPALSPNQFWNSKYRREFDSVSRALKRAVHGENVVIFNDSRTTSFASVKEAFCTAIKAEAEKEAAAQPKEESNG